MGWEAVSSIMAYELSSFCGSADRDSQFGLYRQKDRNQALPVYKKKIYGNHLFVPIQNDHKITIIIIITIIAIIVITIMTIMMMMLLIMIKRTMMIVIMINIVDTLILFEINPPWRIAEISSTSPKPSFLLPELLATTPQAKNNQPRNQNQ